jgi:hypothetical protein
VDNDEQNGNHPRDGRAGFAQRRTGGRPPEYVFIPPGGNGFRDVDTMTIAWSDFNHAAENGHVAEFTGGRYDATRKDYDLTPIKTG